MKTEKKAEHLTRVPRLFIAFVLPSPVPSPEIQVLLIAVTEDASAFF